MRIEKTYEKNRKVENNTLFDNNAKKIVVIGCIAIIIALVTMSSISMFITNRAVIKKLKSSDLKNMAESISAVIEGRIEKAVDASLMMANDPIVYRWIKSKDENSEYGLITKEKMGKLVNDFGYNTAFIVSNRTHHYWSYHGNKFELLDTVSKKDMNDDWFFNTIGMKKRHEINIDQNIELGDTFVWINTLVGDVDKPIAITGLGMNLSQVINELINKESKGEVENDIWLVDGKGAINLSKNSAYLGKNLSDYLPKALKEKIIDSGNAVDNYEIAEYKNKSGKLYDIAYKSIKGTEWKLIVQIPRIESLSFLNAVIINTVISCLIIILLMVALFYFISNRIANPYKRAMQLNLELEKIVDQRTKELNEQNTRIQDSIEYAKMIQETILPSESELKKILKKYFIIYKPKDIVGGDFYWIRSFEQGFMLIVGDCTGHGVPGALMTTAVNAMLNQIVDSIGSNPSLVLHELDRRIKQSFRKESNIENVQYGLDAAVLYVSNSKEILFSGANLSLIVVCGDSAKEIKASGGTINCIDSPKENHYQNAKIEYEKEMSLYISTDGLKDQPGGDKKIPYGRGKLIKSIEESKRKDIQEQAEFILESFMKYAINENMRDDLTMVGVKLD